MNTTPYLAIMPHVGPMELILILFIILIIFGANKLPKIAKDLGHGIREFKKSISGESDEKKDDSNGDKKA